MARIVSVMVGLSVVVVIVDGLRRVVVRLRIVSSP
jgi:hypothetical protein